MLISILLRYVNVMLRYINKLLRYVNVLLRCFDVLLRYFVRNRMTRSFILSFYEINKVNNMKLLVILFLTKLYARKSIYVVFM